MLHASVKAVDQLTPALLFCNYKRAESLSLSFRIATHLIGNEFYVTRTHPLGRCGNY